MKQATVSTILTCALLFLCPFRADASWDLPAVQISSTSSSKPQIGIDKAGNAVAVWQESNGSNTIIMGAHFTRGVGWSIPVPLSAAGQNAINPKVAVDLKGNAVAVWVRFNGSNMIIQGSKLPFSASSWIATNDLSTPGFDAKNPQVSIDPRGNAVAIWVWLNSFGNKVTQAASLLHGSFVWHQTNNLTVPSQNTNNPQVALDPDGNAVAVWVNLSLSKIQAATLPFKTFTWSTPVATLSKPLAKEPKVVIDSNGNATATWTRDTGSHLVIESARLPFMSPTWDSPLTASGAGSSSKSDIAVDPNGTVIAVWSTSIVPDVFIQSATLESSASSWSPITALTYPGESASHAQVATDAHGNAVAVWDNTIGTARIVQAAIRLFSGIWTIPGTTLSATDEAATFPQVAMNPLGYAVVDFANVINTRIYATSFTPLFPPRRFEGTLQRKKHSSHDKKYALHATWKPQNQPSTIAYYKIYEEGVFIKLIPAHVHKFHTYVEHSENLDTRFQISAVSTDNIESVRVNLKIVKIDRSAN